MNEFLTIMLILILSYLIGSIPTGVIVSKKFFGFDIRKKGSGNMGSTNAFRTLGWKWGLFVQIFDIAKGFIAVTVIAGILGKGISIPNTTFFEDITIIKMLAGVTAVCGHIWSVFVDFKGGKGVNTAAGMLIGLIPVDVSIALGAFIIAVIFSGYVSLGSIVAAFSIPSSMLVRYNIFGANIEGYHLLIYFSLGIMILVLYTHRTNIKRLIEGSENKFSKLQLIRCKPSQEEELTQDSSNQ